MFRHSFAQNTITFDGAFITDNMWRGGKENLIKVIMASLKCRPKDYVLICKGLQVPMLDGIILYKRSQL